MRASFCSPGSALLTTDLRRDQMFGTATRPTATRALLLGSGELGKEVAIELQRLGIEVIAADRYANAPPCRWPTRPACWTCWMVPPCARLVAEVKPDLIIPEIEAIATDTLAALEQGVKVVPNARATQLTMNRGDPSPRRRNPGTAHLCLPLCPEQEEFVASVEAIGFALRGKTGDELLRQGAEPAARPRQAG